MAVDVFRKAWTCFTTVFSTNDYQWPPPGGSWSHLRLDHVCPYEIKTPLEWLVAWARSRPGITIWCVYSGFRVLPEIRYRRWDNLCKRNFRLLCWPTIWINRQWHKRRWRVANKPWCQPRYCGFRLPDIYLACIDCSEARALCRVLLSGFRVI